MSGHDWAVHGREKVVYKLHSAARGWLENLYDLDN